MTLVEDAAQTRSQPKARLEAAGPQGTPPSKPRAPVQRYHTFPRMKQTSFYDSSELLYIDESSDDEVVQSTGRPPSSNYEEKKKRRRSKLLDRGDVKPRDKKRNSERFSMTDADIIKAVKNIRHSLSLKGKDTESIEMDDTSDAKTSKAQPAKTSKLVEDTPAINGTNGAITVSNKTVQEPKLNKENEVNGDGSKDTTYIAPKDSITINSEDLDMLIIDEKDNINTSKTKAQGSKDGKMYRSLLNGQDSD